MKVLKPIFGPIYPIVCATIVLIIIFTLSRLGLAVWHFDRVSDAGGWGTIFLSGLRVDIASICYLLILPALLSSLFSGEHLVGRIWHWILRVWITAGLWLVVYMEVATPPFILEYDLRPNRLFVEYLIYPKEVFSMLWTGYKLELFIGLVVSVLTVVWGWKWSKTLVTDLRFPKWYWRPVIAVVCVAIGVMGARSSLGHRPLNPAMVAFASDPLVNDLTLNSSYSVLFAAKQMGSEASAFAFYPKMANDKIIEEVRDSMNIDQSQFVSDREPTLATHKASYQGKPKNIVILLLESHGARYVKSLGGIDASPNLDKLINEGWAFTRMYATGTRSVRGIEAVTTGFSPTPARSVVKLGKSQTNFFTIADLLKQRHYHTQFIYGGESHFDNMKSFFLGNGFVDMQDFPTFANPKFVGSWGASDQDVFNKADEQFTQLSSQTTPFFSLVFTSSNHSPFEYPDNVIEPYNEPKQTVENAVKYADFAVGEFVKKAKASNYWDNTIFAVIADHDARAYGTLPVPIDHFKIPAIIFGGGVEPRLDDRLVSQIDLAPTLLSLAGIDSVNPMIGFDLTHDVPVEKQRAMMQRDKNYGYMTADNQVVVIEPERGISTYQYDPIANSMEPKPVSDEIVTKAHANAMWGSLAYKENYYVAQNNYQTK
ncbi:LTA synthase family protein [Vibrio fluvialis]|uniref:LTA synthase family protein n=1 Tax=Vibrio fluvialis TaxID=676 RepID=UPI000509A1E9|nr:LTA synthase family protein [Vibrio fluvialis]EKO3488559.1 LTA synthase family protein [Vibrio fluvialis]ELI5731752.1 LTA synthase family protein [Vibrio fluvialis]MBY7895160.1 LTA synthase family protein [Vibrio fluvialis]MBY7973542.1 LTA synthase family protein [Vibrio fluvialis]MBY7997955.1 LTA synthase family protein [Vibrio fluvialis]